jgi:hypothetical protein
MILAASSLLGLAFSTALAALSASTIRFVLLSTHTTNTSVLVRRLYSSIDAINEKGGHGFLYAYLFFDNLGRV